MNLKRNHPNLMLVGMAAIVLALLPIQSWAHCDALDGPVITEARQALSAGDVTPILKWIAPEDEPTIREVFSHVVKVRQTSDAARELADRYFFETLVRVHRASEGEPFTGLKPAGSDPGPGVKAADQALAGGSVETLVEKITQHTAAGIRQRFQAAHEAKAHKDESVAAGRDYVKAYVQYVHYVKNLHVAIAGHHGHGAEGEEEHAHQ